jgi:stearoyl-CoA desaturase (delta-9 desaturase)
MFAAALVLVATYTLTIMLTSVGYHRGLTHGGVRLRPVFRRLLLSWGNWLTGIDPQVWVVMHRLHHTHADQPEDPHSPVHVGVLGIPRQQIRSYVQVFRGLRQQDPLYTCVAPDVPLSWPTRSGLWLLPYLLHVAIAVGLGLATGSGLLGAAYWLGMMSHGTQGVIINALGHAWGRRNFDTPDNSRNNHLAAWLVLGEGYQNNHHRFPASARFSYRWWEFDAGYGACRLLQFLGVLEIDRATLIPSPTKP